MAGATPGGTVSDSVGNRSESDALINLRAFGSYATKAAPGCGSGADLHPTPLSGQGHSDVMRRKKHGDRGTFVRSAIADLASGRSRFGFEGFIRPSDVRSGPKEMRIPPLRSAVQMGSDVSPGSSVTLDR